MMLGSVASQISMLVDWFVGVENWVGVVMVKEEGVGLHNLSGFKNYAYYV